MSVSLAHLPIKTADTSSLDGYDYAVHSLLNGEDNTSMTLH